jgi:ATP-dependent RNA helicase DeaD
MSDFKNLGLSKPLVDAVTSLGFESPTPIQTKAIPRLLQERTDLVGLAQTGTGKTAAFGLPLLDLIDPTLHYPQALIVVPTRELCLQVTDNLQGFSKFLPELRIATVYGGASIRDQILQVKKGAQIIIATPGRLIDLMSRKAVDLHKVDFVVLDEADEMLNMGFQEDIDTILQQTPEERQIWLFSATMPEEVRRISMRYMKDPFELTVGEKNTSNKNIDHQYVLVNPKDKYVALKRLIDYYPDIFGLVFCRTKIEAQETAEKLIKDGYNADSLHGDLSQPQRDKVMRSYRGRVLQLLVATDVAARGIDVDDITHVFHLNLPDEVEFYTHRSGRTARIGKKGTSVAIVSKKELGKIKEIERKLQTTFTKMPVPNGREICEKQLFSIVHKFNEIQVIEEEIESFLPAIYEELQDLSKEELIKRIASVEFNRFLDYYRNAPDLNVDEKSVGSTRSGFAGDYQRMFINLGKKDGIEKGKLLGMLLDQCDLRKSDIGKIDIKGVYSFFEVTKKQKDQVLVSFRNVEYSGRRVRVEATDENDKGKGNWDSKPGAKFTGNRFSDRKPYPQSSGFRADKKKKAFYQKKG